MRGLADALSCSRPGVRERFGRDGAFIRARRDTRSGSGLEVADSRSSDALRESWSIPTSVAALDGSVTMIFDDHGSEDDWKSLSPGERDARAAWWANA